MTADADVVVVGAGFAGLRAARDCSDAGAATILLEARHRLGGRTYTKPFDSTGDLVELGGSYFLSEHNEVGAEIERYGLGTRRCDLPASFRWHTGGVLRSGLLPVPAEEWRELKAALLRVADDADRYAKGADRELAALSLAQYLDRIDTTAAVRDFLFGWSLTSIGAPAAEGAIGDGLASVADHGGLLGYAKMLELTPTPGWSRLAEEMAATPGIELCLGHVVTRIGRRRHGFEVETTAGTFEAPWLVIALPINVLPHVELDLEVPAGIAAVAGANAGAAIKVLIRAADVPKRCWGIGRGEGLGQLIWDHEDADATWLVGFGARVPDFDPDDRAAVARAVRAYFPEASLIDSEWHDWNTDPYARGTWRTALPGHRPHDTANDPDSPLQFAGADIGRRAQGWIEGALSSGAEAAANLTRQFARIR
jgi:monoamine oxidase